MVDFLLEQQGIHYYDILILDAKISQFWHLIIPEW